ncbi:MAG: hypothetical protein KFF50_10425 [Desulfatitalea sp.]|nr:hypothetical protein [Desulfatitalea sp.]
MSEGLKLSIVMITILALLAVPGAVMAESSPQFKDPQVEAGSMVADALLVRPLGIVATVAGFGLFVISVPFSALGRNVGDAWDALVVYPAKFTFARPLGDFD